MIEGTTKFEPYKIVKNGTQRPLRRKTQRYGETLSFSLRVLSELCVFYF